MQQIPDNSKGFSAEFEGGPIPGQSLTRSPQSYPFEQAPQFTDPEQAFQSLLIQLSEEKTAVRLLNLMDLGIPVYSIVYTLLMTGFTEGKWTPDVALLLAEPLASLLIKLGRDAGIDIVPGVEDDEDDLMELVAQKYVQQGEQELDGMMPEMSDSGLMEPV